MHQRSSYPNPFKAQVVQECLQPTLAQWAGQTGMQLQPLVNARCEAMLA
jgi:transposase-like protein